MQRHALNILRIANAVMSGRSGKQARNENFSQIMSLQVRGTLPLLSCLSNRASGKFANCEKKTYKALDMFTLVQSLQSKEKKEKSERKITALLMGKLQVNQNHLKCPVVGLTF